MAYAHLGFGTCGFQGRIGDFVYKRYGDKTVVTKVPQFKSWSKKQKKGRSRFAAASAHAAKVQRDPALRASYALWAEKKGLTIRSAAMADFLTVPEMESVTTRHYNGAPGGSLGISGAQKYKFVSATVIIRDQTDRILEEGSARQLGPDFWSYDATRDLRGSGRLLVEGVGVDRLGREARLIVEVAV